jgi:hypothetical protein
MKLHRWTTFSPLQFSVALPILVIVGLVGAAQAATNNNSDPSAIAWASQAMTALTGGTQVNGVTLQANVTRTVAGKQQTGTMTLQSSGIANSQISVTIGSATVSETRSYAPNAPSGQWTDPNGTTHKMAQHNCWTDPVWFFPALSMLANYADPNLVLRDLGQEQHRGSTVEHLRVYRTGQSSSPETAHVLALMSVTDYFLDSQTALPVATVSFAFADNDSDTSIPVEIVFSSYQRVNQGLVPYQITKYYNGTQLFQISVTSAQVQ